MDVAIMVKRGKDREREGGRCVRNRTRSKRLLNQRREKLRKGSERGEERGEGALWAVWGKDPTDGLNACWLRAFTTHLEIS